MKQKITSAISELAGVFAADGSMQEKHLCFWGNPKEDREFYDNHLTSLFKQAFNIDIKPHEKPSNSVYGFYVCDSKIINFFHTSLGFPFGKKTYTVAVPRNIFCNVDREVQCAFLRGFFAGDGCLNFDKRYGTYQKILRVIHTYPRIQIKCVSENLIYDMSVMLNRLGIHNFIARKISKKANEVDSYMLQISGVTRMEKWVKQIGFSNHNHLSKYEIFKKHGFVPSNLAYKEKIMILEGKLNPWSFYPERACSLAWIGRQKNR
jgi:hypothetical protein